LLTLFNGFIHFTHDYSALKANILVLIIFVIGLILYPQIKSTFSNKNDPFISILQFITWLFIVQSVIEILAFVFPGVADIIHSFQKEEVSAKGMGIRALALSGNPF